MCDMGSLLHNEDVTQLLLKFMFTLSALGLEMYWFCIRTFSFQLVWKSSDEGFLNLETLCKVR